jgi:hypothetical protein
MRHHVRVRPASDELDARVRLHVYRRLLDDGAAPSAVETAGALEVQTGDAEDAYRRLADGRALVLAPGTLDVWMANPLSAVPTPFRVHVGERSHWGNCIWDALGIPAMLGVDGRIETSCGDCGEPMSIAVRGGQLEPAEGVIHFAVPAAHWWDDIGFN